MGIQVMPDLSGHNADFCNHLSTPSFLAGTAFWLKLPHKGHVLIFAAFDSKYT
jgi:hypothetical protein